MATNIVMGEFWLFLPIGPDAIGLCGKMAIACLWLNPPCQLSPFVDKGAAAACRWVKFQCRQLAAHSLASFYLPRHSIHSMRYSSTNSIHTRQPLRRLYNHSTRAPIHFSSFFLPQTKYDFLFFYYFFLWIEIYYWPGTDGNATMNLFLAPLLPFFLRFPPIAHQV